MKKDYSGQAFPTLDEDGMTIRDFFAAQAIEAARHEVVAEAGMYFPDGWSSDDIAAKAYEIAEAMLDERAK